jgi:hypothetical protein
LSVIICLWSQIGGRANLVLTTNKSVPDLNVALES